MRTIGFPISHKENEYRRAILPCDVRDVLHTDSLYIETGYGEVLGLSDKDYQRCGAHIVSHNEVLLCDVICDPKIGDADYLTNLNNQVIFGWIHAVQNRHITDTIIQNRLTAYAWEDMFEQGKHCFWKNNEIAGEAAVFHAFMCHGVFPYGKKVAVIGRGNTARGAIKMLCHLGADIYTYDRHSEALLREELAKFDVIVNAVLWDTNRKDHIISIADLNRMKADSLIIDISCDRHGGIESSQPTTIEHPTYIFNGIRHYVVDHTPSLFWKTTSKSLSEVVKHYLDPLIMGQETDVLFRCKCMDNGEIIDNRIKTFQGR